MNEFEISVQRFDEFASEYANRFMDVGAYRTHFDQFCNSIENKQAKILELACGPGNVTRYIKQQLPNAEIIAIDLAPRMIDIARKMISDVDFKVMDVRDISTFEQKFDAIMCSFCLPFLSKPDTDKLIADCSQQLNKGGILYLSTMEGDESKAGFEPTSFSGNAKVYFNYHLPHNLENSLINSGFLIQYNIRQEYFEPDNSVTTDLILIAKKG